MSYKRNQIEEAIARIFIPNCEKPPSELRTRIKRLLDLDRSIGRKLPHSNPEIPADRLDQRTRCISA
jgi:hypothetical protein